jgi:secondary thiamine-phosphate synthase enzyme
MMTATVTERVNTALKVYHELIPLETRESLQFIDLTEQFIELVRRSGVRNGFANIQTRHTTTAVMINENEPLLIQDMKKVLQRLAPHDGTYHHDNFEVRTTNLCADEEKNGHAHCKAMFLKTSESVNIVDGRVQLGRWQRVFFLELDRAKKRTASVMVIGQEM